MRPDLRLGCVPDLPLQRLQSFLGALYDSDPAVQPEIVHLRTAEQLDRLRSGDLDVGLLHDPGSTTDLEMARLFPGEPLAVVSPANHLRDAPPPPPLARQTLRMFPRAVDPALHDCLLAAVEAAGHVFGRMIETGDSDIRDVLLAVAEGGGVALAAPSTLEVAGEIGAILRCETLDPAVWMPPTMVAWGVRPRPGLDEQVQAARNAARELRSG